MTIINRLPEEELLKGAITSLDDACSFLYEIESDEGRIFATMCNSLLKCISAIHHGHDPRHPEEDDLGDE